MDKRQFTYETKCRRCNEITEWHGGYEEISDKRPIDTSVKQFLYMMQEKQNHGTTYYCDNCSKDTVQDVVSYEPSRNPY